MSKIPDVLDERVLILAPTGKDAVLASEIFRREGLCSLVCEDVVAVADALRAGAGALMLAEEALEPRELPILIEALRRQPPWSDVPVLVLTRGRNPQEDARLIQVFSPAANVTLLERPLSTAVLTTAVQAALRLRRRQYEVRDLIDEQKQVAEALRASQEEVLELNAELEQRVATRTAELRASNEELEAFCYSVSHDLRAPLRAIDGFALAVLQQTNGSLDDSSRDCLERSRRAVHRMQRLIDDLLGLSRLTRTEVKWQRVDLSALAGAQIHTLRQEQPERQVETVIAPGVWAYGDRNLLQIALGNLLGNAWKFTSKTSTARIEFGERTVEDRPAIFVQDNGAGFDMTYAGKLFMPFQRLHTNHDFPGSGIGLAIVQRVIRRHNGEVWAEGRKGSGACFYLRLPPEPPGGSN